MIPWTLEQKQLVKTKRELWNKQNDLNLKEWEENRHRVWIFNHKQDPEWREPFWDDDNELRKCRREQRWHARKHGEPIDDYPGSHCYLCEHDPCVFVEGKEEAVRQLEMKMLETSDDDSNEEEWKDNLKRKWMYRHFTHILRGFLGKGVRYQLPSCIVVPVRNLYPGNGEDDYVGFKEA